MPVPPRHPNIPGNWMIALQAVGAAAVIAIATAAGGVPVDTGAPPPAPSASLERVAGDQLNRILGKDVRSADGAVIGRLVDLLVDRDGRPRAAVIDFGGFLGVGSRKIAVDWETLHFGPAAKGDAITVDLDRNQVRAAPEYRESRQVVAVLGLPTADEGQ